MLLFKKNFFRVNRFQQPIVLASLIPAFLYCSFSTFFVLFLHSELINLVEYHSHVGSVNIINKWGLVVLICIWSFFVLIYLWAQGVSARTVGAFERLIREMDEMLAQEDFEKKLQARDRDHLANEVISRVNQLIVRARIGKTRQNKPPPGRF